MEDFIGGVFVGLAFGAIAATGIAIEISNDCWESEAVKKGHAEYVLQVSKAVWQWKERKEPAK